MKASQHESYWTFTILTLLIPLVGFILGILYLAKDKKIDRKLGEHILALSIIIVLIEGVAFGAYITLSANSQLNAVQGQYNAN